MIDSITLHQIPLETMQLLREESLRQGTDIETLVHIYIKQGLPANVLQRDATVNHELDSLSGTWSESDFADFTRTVADFGSIDEDLWK
ncbi:MAG: hypothetical protein IT426_11830 [Pirellulales bacterium]|nr:hypothetical protein [Pirellulales bacterium]